MRGVTEWGMVTPTVLPAPAWRRDGEPPDPVENQPPSLLQPQSSRVAGLIVARIDPSGLGVENGALVVTKSAPKEG